LLDFAPRLLDTRLRCGQGMPNGRLLFRARPGSR
jgi:hypothetical protein